MNNITCIQGTGIDKWIIECNGFNYFSGFVFGFAITLAIIFFGLWLNQKDKIKKLSSKQEEEC